MVNAYITNTDSSVLVTNTVSVIDTSTDTVSATISIGYGTEPYGAAVTPDGSTVYVTNQNAANVSVINTATNTVSTTISVGSEPLGVAITPDGSKAYVANTASGTVSVINTATNTVSATITVGSDPSGVAITPDGSKAYVANYGSNTVTPITISNNTAGTAISVGTEPLGVAITPDGSKAYVTNSYDGTVSVINTATNTVSTTITVGTSPDGVAITPGGGEAYVANSNSFSVSVIDTSSDTVSKTITISGNDYPHGVAITPDGSKAYVACETNTGGGSVAVINTTTHTVSTYITVGDKPISLGQFIQSPTQSTGVDMSAPQGRLTLSSTAPVMTTDATAQTTIYYLPYQGNIVPVYNGSSFVNQLLGSSGISLALDSNNAHTGYQQSGKLFDIFAFMNGGLLTLGTSPAWTNSTMRSNAISQLNGIWVNSSSITLRFGSASGNTTSVSANQATYLGTMYATGNGQTGMQFKPAAASGGSANVLGLWNAYNQVLTYSAESDSHASWTYGTNTWRYADNNANNSITYVDGLGTSNIEADYQIDVSAGTGALAAIGVALNSATPVRSKGTTVTTETALLVKDSFTALQGLNVVYAVEYATGNSTYIPNGGASMGLNACIPM